MTRIYILIVVVAILIVTIGAVQFYRERQKKSEKRSKEDPRYFPVLLKYKLDGVWVGSFYSHGVLCYAEVFGIPEGCECSGLRVWALQVGFAERHLMEAKKFGSPRYCCGHEGVVLSRYDLEQDGWLCEYYKDGISFCGTVFGFSKDDNLEGCSVNVVRAPKFGDEAFQRMI